ncbi:SLAC1 anion channel family protein [bacterium]|nr:SLAC1 anion channel family protein [bacterium]MBU1995479.1 SLAC1 anion channel family protein [bacterium]
MQIKQRSLEFFPVQLFAVVMGVSGLSIAFAKAYHILGAPYIIYEVFLLIDTLLFLLIFTTYLLKFLKYPQAVKKEFLHPIKSAFMATISISFLLVSIAYYDYAPTVSLVFWYIGTPLQLYFTLNILSFWINNEFKEVHSNPAWFIPIVGNVLVPVVGVDAAPVFISVFFFSIGLFFWFVLFTLVMYRIIFHHPMAKKLIPTLFIFIAPPAVAFISYFRMSYGSIDMFSMFLYFIALATFFLLVFMMKRYDREEFFISWWAYTFPLAAITIATILLNMAFKNALLYYGSYMFLLLTTFVVGFVTWKTLEAVKKDKLCREEKE